MTVTLVTPENPCSSCQIAAELMRGLILKLTAEISDAEFTTIYVKHPRDLRGVNGLEVERLPAVLIDGEQISAGNIMHRRQLLAEIEARRVFCG